MSFESLAQRYRNERDEIVRKCLPAALPAQFLDADSVESVPNECGLLSPAQIQITNMNATELLEAMATGKFKAEQVVLAFGMRAAIAHQLVCCLTDLWLEDALEEARALDSYFERTGKTKGPLHGLPISLKDQFEIKGRITSLGFLSVHDQQQISEYDAHICVILRDAGAVFFCHTNLPQTIMHLECKSFWGRTTNPFNRNLSSGGSTGGEGALMALRASPFGWGTDIGGSVRSPAANCGLYGLRPTANRIPNGGVRPYAGGRESILGTAGPFAHSLRDLQFVMKILLGPETAPWELDPTLLEMPWGKGRNGGWQSGDRRLVVGVMSHDEQVRPVAPVQRALRSVVEKLKKRDDEVEIIEVPAFQTRQGWELIRKLYWTDGGQRVHDLLDQSHVKEPLDPLTTWLLEEAGEPVQPQTPHSIWDLTMQRDAFRKAYRAHWTAHGIDVLLCPNAPVPAAAHGEAKWWAYTSQFNLVDYPAIAFPLGIKVDPKLDSMQANQEITAAGFLSEDEKFAHAGYSPEKYANAPLSLQLVARRFHDEELLDALALIEAVLKK